LNRRIGDKPLIYVHSTIYHFLIYKDVVLNFNICPPLACTNKAEAFDISTRRLYWIISSFNGSLAPVQKTGRGCTTSPFQKSFGLTVHTTCPAVGFNGT
jgi:hypothetical protein